jgi:phage I-like protein
MNETTKGPFLFDDEAARIVLAQFEREGVDMIADLEHLSLNPDSPNYDPDARAHFRLEVRDGELWACGVSWSPDGQRRLTEKTQRYISPVAMRDKDTKRVLGVFNVGLVAQPATFHAQPLVAASKGRVAEQTLACKAIIAMLAKHYGRKI